MPNFVLPHIDWLDEALALEDSLERAASLLGPTPFLGVSLPGLLMWRDRYHYVLARKGPASFLLSSCPGEVYAPRPPAPFTEENLKTLFDYLRLVNGPPPGPSRVEGLTESQALEAESWGYAKRVATTDYVYDREKLAGLHGDSYRDRRNEINSLARDNEIHLRPLDHSDLSSCDDLYGRWMADRSAHLDAIGKRMMEQSRAAHRQVLANHAAWGLEAWGLEVSQRFAAYSVVGPLQEDTQGVWAEVSDLTLRGASAYIFVNLCRNHSGFTWVNSGDAEFLPSLRESKEHWHPARRLLQYAVDPLRK